MLSPYLDDVYSTTIIKDDFVPHRNTHINALKTRQNTSAPTVTANFAPLESEVTVESGSNSFAGKIKVHITGGDARTALKNVLTLTFPRISDDKITSLHQEGPDNANMNHNFRVTSRTQTDIVIGNDATITPGADKTFYIVYLNVLL
jgi:hypothetical protein